MDSRVAQGDVDIAGYVTEDHGNHKVQVLLLAAIRLTSSYLGRRDLTNLSLCSKRVEEQVLRVTHNHVRLTVSNEWRLEPYVDKLIYSRRNCLRGTRHITIATQSNTSDEGWEEFEIAQVTRQIYKEQLRHPEDTWSPINKPKSVLNRKIQLLIERIPAQRLESFR